MLLAVLGQHRALAAASCALLAVVSIACSDDERPPPLGWSDTNPDEFDAQAPADGGADGPSYTGPTATVSGSLFAMEPPSFHPIRTEEPDLDAPATVHVYAHRWDYMAEYTPNAGFELVDVPAVSGLYVVARDVNDGKGILPSSIGAVATEGARWIVPVVKRSSIEAIYGAVTPQQQLDPARAQVLVSVVTCDLLGSVPMPGVHITVADSAGGVVYDTAAGWVFDREASTGPGGMAIIVNMVAEPYPGIETSISYRKGEGEVNTGLSYKPFQGGVSRVYITDPC